jgi:hypothetical protein
MKRKELIEKLLALGDDDTEVEITDGFLSIVYAGEFSVELFDRNDGDYIIDIGVGGMIQ